jgi:hypothetical protein
MYVQYSEGLPGRVVDAGERKIYCRSDRDLWREIESFYDRYQEGNPADFAIDPDYAMGLHLFVERVREGRRYPLLKGQVTGPVSFGLTVTDEGGKPIIYDETLSDVMVKLLSMKARWMRDLLHSTGSAEEVLIFFDEPYLFMVGSALVSVQPDFVVDALNQCVEGIGCLTGVHCCGNTDWSLLMRTRVNIINFDACEYMDNLALYPEELTAFLQKGGFIAWGLVPNSEAVRRETVSTLRERFERGYALLVKRGVPERLLQRGMLVTPSCGLGGTADEETAAEIYALAAEFAEEMNERRNL